MAIVVPFSAQAAPIPQGGLASGLSSGISNMLMDGAKSALFGRTRPSSGGLLGRLVGGLSASHGGYGQQRGGYFHNAYAQPGGYGDSYAQQGYGSQYGQQGHSGLFGGLSHFLGSRSGSGYGYDQPFGQSSGLFGQHSGYSSQYPAYEYGSTTSRSGGLFRQHYGPDAYNGYAANDQFSGNNGDYRYGHHSSSASPYGNDQYGSSSSSDQYDRSDPSGFAENDPYGSAPDDRYSAGYDRFDAAQSARNDRYDSGGYNDYAPQHNAYHQRQGF